MEFLSEISKRRRRVSEHACGNHAKVSWRSWRLLALANGDSQNAGVTVHLVNTGIDTGGVLFQDRIHPGPADNFITYPVLQVAAGVRLMKRAVHDALDGTLCVQQPDMPSKLYYLPTLWQYWRT
jgi:phosphoribosylglycinamide formyltransferase 1